MFSVQIIHKLSAVLHVGTRTMSNLNRTDKTSSNICGKTSPTSAFTFARFGARTSTNARTHEQTEKGRARTFWAKRS